MDSKYLAHLLEVPLYLGDGVFVQAEDGRLVLTTEVLTTEDGAFVTNRIVLKADVLLALLRIVERCYRHREAG
jgi:hypothetical protein